jgi:hypothetical protein
LSLRVSTVPNVAVPAGAVAGGAVDVVSWGGDVVPPLPVARRERAEPALRLLVGIQHVGLLRQCGESASAAVRVVITRLRSASAVQGLARSTAMRASATGRDDDRGTTGPMPSRLP